MKSLLRLAAAMDVHGYAHITGGGLTDNMPRVLPDGLGVRLDPRAWRREPVWDWIQCERPHQRCGNAPHVQLRDRHGRRASPRTDAEAALDAPAVPPANRPASIGEVVAGAGVQIG